jgi:hypothetical protein
MTFILTWTFHSPEENPQMVLPAQPKMTIFRITRTVILSAVLLPAFLLFPSHAYSLTPPVVDLTHGLRWTVRIQTEQSGKTSQSHVLTYSATPSALRIDQPDNKGVDLILWRLDLGKVYAVDTRTRTYQVQSIKKILSYQGFSDLIGQHAGSNPGDVHTVGIKTETVAGYICTPETYRHQFRGTVVGMINGDQKTVVCASSAVKGFNALQSFRENLLAMGGEKLKSRMKSQNPSPAFYLSITRVTHYKTGFIIRILNSIGLYDQSKVPAYQKESSSVLTVSEESFPPSTFSLSPDYRKAIVLPRTGGAP